VKCLLIASIFPPINGGSAVVYDSLCRFGPPGSITVLAPWRHYYTGEVIQGWRDFDRRAPYRVHRVELLRPRMKQARSLAQSIWLQLSTDLPLKLRLMWVTARLVKREQVDIVCIGELTSGSWLGVFCQRWLGCKMINFIHGEEITTRTTYRSYGRLRRAYLQRADAVVAVSRFTRNALQELMGVPEEKITLIENGVDAQRFSPGPRPDSLVQRYGLQGRRVLLTVGRLVPRKGIDRTIEAMPRILQNIPDAHYLIVGDGEYRPALEALVQSHALEERVTFAGRVDECELVDHYRLCDVFVMPNRELSDHDTEGFGLVFLEANACAKAVIGGRAGGAVEAVRDGQNGLLVDARESGPIAEAVTRLLTDDALRTRIEVSALEIAQASSSARGAERFHQLCCSLVGEPCWTML
jgi:phosphatidylinositol alpha-1,6-mannosyltransferase